jgi:RNA polymerase sigma factor (TIGR02999 family)
VFPDRDARLLVLPMSEVTRILSAIGQGDLHAAEQLLPLVYDELRKLAAQRLAREKPGHTLQATALVHEAFLRLVDVQNAQHFDGRGHFFAAAAEAMRRILVESVRRKKSKKHGGEGERVPLDQIEIALPPPDDDLLALDEALTRLAAERPDVAELVKLRFFAGLTMDEAAQTLGISPATAFRQWNYARAWLFRAVSDPS